jgi:hypothetical protein
MDKKITFKTETIRKVPTFKSTWHRMRELVIISLNILYIKDYLQQLERARSKALYLNFPDGPIAVMELNLHARKRSLNKRMKVLLEDLMESKHDQRYTWLQNASSDYVFNIELENACFTKKQLDKGYALFTNVRDVTFALDLRKGSLLIVNDYENDTTDANLRSLEYTAYHDGSVLKYFDIETSDPLPKENLRY